MSNSDTPTDLDFSNTFSDTSILYNYTLQQDDGYAKKVLSESSRENVVSKNVRDEYENVMSNRKKALKSMLRAADNDSFEEWEIPDSLGLSLQDEDWCEELHSDLCDIGSEDQIKTALSQAVRKFRKGHQNLFKGADKWIDDVTSRNDNTLLRGYLQGIVEDRGDRKIICDAGAWSKNGGSGTFLTVDHTHMLNNKSEIMELIDRNRKAGSLFMLRPEEFLELEH